MRTICLIALCGLMCFNAAIAFDLKEYEQVIITMSKNATYEAEFEKSIQNLLQIEPNYFDYNPFNDHLKPFDCPALATAPATSVHNLTPKDIKYVGAIGDSLTAALGSNAKTVIGLLFEYKGRSWSVGGDSNLEDLVTLPNILKKYNSNLSGFSTGKNFVPIPNKNRDHMNCAVSGQEANHLPDQARELVSRFKEQASDYLTAWKLITLFIGGNDLCDFCKDLNLHAPATFINDIKQALDIFASELPNTFVNLVTVLPAAQVKSLNEGLICKILHKFECPCAAYPESPAQEELLDQYFKQYVNYTSALVDSNIYERDDFTVVVQPLFEQMPVPLLPSGKVDLSYFAPDCFHLSTKGHSQSAIALWNNMFTPIGEKAKAWKIDEQILCPTPESPYLYTKRNSKKN